ncbi:family 16 glycosylhydrolase [Parvicella tangerina]|uniref:GH16 domain-containing protein n=1 Tax=Parvicella tangerina TaxID=2829795 RepID=A0A916JQ04_9FLAO|nr:family 16 glycosylhydrolase [Parvicella tangerina]CAG5085135.1 hypothetical protein CRYO30217_02658 [Parvicella tangerina]
MNNLKHILLFTIPLFIWTQGFTQLSACQYSIVHNQEVTECTNGDFVLTFEDNFDGSELNEDVWEIIPWAQGDGVEINTLEPDNLEVSNGTLKIMISNIPKERRHTNWLLDSEEASDGEVNLRWYNYSSSNIWTKDKTFRYGKYEIRARMDSFKGMFPAFWIYGGDNSVGGEIQSELDFFEVFHPGEHDENDWTIKPTLHYDSDNDGETSDGNYCVGTDKDMSDLDEWHTYTCYFYPHKVEIYKDNVLEWEEFRFRSNLHVPIECESEDVVYSVAKEMVGWPSDYGSLIINMAVQAEHLMDDNPSNAFPCTYEIDYVRYWEFTDCVLDQYAPANVGASWPVNTSVWGPLYTGWEVYVIPNAVLNTGSTSKLIANDQILSMGDFEVEIGANFEAWIDPEMCSLYKQGESHENDSIIIQNTEPQSINTATPKLVYKNKVFPSPFKSELFVEVSDDFIGGEYSVYNMLGSVVASGVLTDRTTRIQGFKEYSSGLYSVVLEKNNLIEVQKIMKK